MTTAFDRHLAAIRAGEIDRTNIIGLRKTLNANARKAAGFSTGATDPKATEDQIFEALALIDRNNPRVIGDLHKTGVAMLQNRRYAKQLAGFEDVIAWPDYFQLCRFDWLGRWGEYAVPVYRLVGQNGGTFKFRTIPWQSGGNGPEIVS